MPFINIRITREGVTQDQREQLIRGATQLMADVLGKKPSDTFVVIDEVEPGSWGIAGETVTARRARGD